MSWYHWKKNEWAPNLQDVKQLDYHVWDTMLGCYQKYTPKLSNTGKLKTALLSIWNDLLHEFTNEAMSSFQKRLRSRVAAAGGYF